MRETLKISRFNSATDNIPKVVDVSVEAFARELCTPIPLDVTAEEFFGGDVAFRKGVKKRLAAFSPARFKESGRRLERDVVAVDLIVLDCDEEQIGIDDIAARVRARRMRGVVHTTISDRGEAPRCYRIVVFTDRAMDAADYATARAECARQLRLKVDPSTKDASRIYYLPARLDGGHFEAVDVAGDLIAVGELLASAQAAASVLAVRAEKSSGSSRSTKGVDARGALPASERNSFLSALDHLATVTPEGEPCSAGGYALPYEQWRNCGFACANGLGDDGREVFDKWSERAGERYDAGGVSALWTAADPDRRGGITYRWVFSEAQARGWTNPGPSTGTKAARRGNGAPRLTEMSLGAELAKRCADRFLVVPSVKDKKIYFREGGRWQRDIEKRATLTEYKTMLKAMTDESRDALDGNRLAQIGKAMNGLEKLRSFQSITEFFAMALPPRNADDFDADPELLV